MRDGLEDLVVAPARFARLLDQVERRRLVRFDQHLDEAEESSVLFLARVELLRESDLVQAEPGVTSGPLEQLLGVLVALELGNPEADPLLRLQRDGSVAELGTEASVGAKCRR